MMKLFFNYFTFLQIICFLIEHSSQQQQQQQQYFLGTHFYINQDNILIDNTLKTVSTLARPYDLVAFIRQSERLARVDHLQTYIDAVDDNTSPSTNSFDDQQQNKIDSTDKCQDYIRDSESLIFQILKYNLYDTLAIPFQLKNLSTDISFNENLATKISTCDRFCRIKPSLLTFDHLPSISTRYDQQEFVRFDDEDFNSTTYRNYEQQARWATKELARNQTSWLAYVYLSRYFSFNSSYHHSIDCLRCALTYGSNYNDLILIELANIVFRYGYIHDAIIFIEKSLDYHLHSKSSNINSLYIRSILHFYLGNLCTIDNRFILAIQFYNRTKILLERIDKFSDNKQLDLFSSSSFGSLTLSSLLNISQQKIDALHCHLSLEFSLQHKHHILQTKLAQLNQLRSITDELIHLNALIKRDMSAGQTSLNNLRQLKTEQKLFICNWKPLSRDRYPSKEICSNQRKYSYVMKQNELCSIHENYYEFYYHQNHSINYDNYDCYPRETILQFSPDYYSLQTNFPFEQKSTFLSLRLAAIEQTQSSYLLDENLSDKTEQITLTSTTTWSTLTSRLPTAVIIQPIEDFILKQSNELYPPLKTHLHLKIIEQQLPTYTDCQIHYFGLPSIGDYPTIWIPLENKGLLNIKQAFYQGLNHQNKHYPLPWSPPLCTLNKPINEHLSIIENHRVLSARSRSKAPINRYDTNMLLNLYLYIDSIIDESLQIEEFGQRLRSVGEKHEHLLPEWIVHLLSSLYWRINGHLPHAIECGLKSHETIIRNKTYKQWSDLTLINLANILYLWGKYEDALDLTQQAYAINSHEPLTNFFLGNLLALTKNNHTAAQEYYRRTLTIDPTNIYARRQLRLSYCHTMYTNWEKIECSPSTKTNCNDKSNSIESTKCNSILSEKAYRQHDVDTTLTSSQTSTNSNDQQTSRSRQAFIDNRSSIDRWLNRTCFISSLKRDDLLNDARRAYHSYGLCSSSSIIGECSQGFDATNQGHDIGHLIIIYDNIKQTFDYTFLFTNDYEHIFLKESKLKCFIYGTGRKSSKCREINLLDPNEINPKHNMTWWRDPSTLYEHLKELIELLNYNEHMNNQTDVNENKFYEKYFSDQYLLSKDLQDKYLLKNTIEFSKNDCDRNQTTIYTPYLSTWISPQTKNIQLNSTFFKFLKVHQVENEHQQPICSYPNIEKINSTKNLQLIDHILQQAKTNLTLYRSETILRPILLNLLFEKNPTLINREIDDQQLIGLYLASGLDLPEYNTSWLYFHILSLYWRLMGNASEALNCLFQSHVLSPNHVEDLTYLSMALIIYNSQKNLNQAIYLLYESLAINPTGLLLTHFTLGNAMGKKGYRDLAEQWYQSTLKLKADFEPAKQRLRAIQC